MSRLVARQVTAAISQELEHLAALELRAAGDPAAAHEGMLARGWTQSANPDLEGEYWGRAGLTCRWDERARVSEVALDAAVQVLAWCRLLDGGVDTLGRPAADDDEREPGDGWCWAMFGGLFRRHPDPATLAEAFHAWRARDPAFERVHPDKIAEVLALHTAVGRFLKM